MLSEEIRDTGIFVSSVRTLVSHGYSRKAILGHFPELSYADLDPWFSPEWASDSDSLDPRDVAATLEEANANWHDEERNARDDWQADFPVSPFDPDHYLSATSRVGHYETRVEFLRRMLGY